MAKIINFPENKVVDLEAEAMLQLARDLDEVITKHLENGSVHYRHVASILAHRLGALIRPVEERSELLDLCERVAARQAGLEAV